MYILYVIRRNDWSEFNCVTSAEEETRYLLTSSGGLKQQHLGFLRTVTSRELKEKLQLKI